MVLIDKQNHLSRIDNDAGYILDIKLSDKEIEVVQKLIHQHALTLVEKYYPEHLSLFSKTPMNMFHQHDQLIDHKLIWTKKNRVFPTFYTNQIKQLPFFAKVKEIFGPIGIANEEDLYPEEIYWRFVRPNQENDVGPIHADKWFWDLGHGKMPEGYFRLKMWIPIWCDKGGNGLRIVPYSHHNNYQCDKVFRDGMYKPMFDEKKHNLNLVALQNNPGESIIFHDRLLHGGCVNRGTNSRVSIEFTMLVKKNV